MHLKKFILSFLVFMVFMFFANWYYNCGIMDSCLKNKNTAKDVILKKVDSIAIKDSLKRIAQLTPKPLPFKFKFKTNYRFITSKNKTIDSLVLYLRSQFEMELIARFLYDPSVEKRTIVDFRVESFIKALTVEHGIDSLRIKTVVDSTFKMPPQTKLFEGLTLSAVKLNQENLKKVTEKLKKRIFYINFKSNKYVPYLEVYNYVKALKSYLLAHPDDKIRIIGHTDSLGEEIDNEWIGMQRAKSVTNYFVSQGIPSELITTISKGETEPIAPNTTSKGRRLNRRIEIEVYSY